MSVSNTQTDGDSEVNTTTEVVETKEGVKVEVKTKRGTSPRDQDTVNVRAYYEDTCEAHDNAEHLVQVAKSHMMKLRNMDEDGLPK